MSGYSVTTRLIKISVVVSITLTHITVNGQQTVNPPVPYQNIQVNYIRTWDATAPEKYDNTLITRPLKDVKMATQYFDGLGRPLQTVIKQGSLETGGTATDMVSAIVYDDFGREKYKYLPFVANTTGGYPTDNGAFKLMRIQACDK